MTQVATTPKTNQVATADKGVKNKQKE